jgi:hypothetical protein
MPMFYRIKIERVEPPTAEAVKAYNERPRYYQPDNMPVPQETVVECLWYEATDEQFAAIRRAALEAMR